jgi:DNA-binding PadR family transcriptional regulator
MNTQDVILGVLMKEPTSGYDIRQKFQNIFSYFFDAGYGTIYPTLAKMEMEGLIDKKNVVQEGKPNKNVYTITEEGKKRFYAYLESPVAPDVLRSDLLVRLHFGDMADPELCIKWLTEAMDKMLTMYGRLSKDFERVRPFITPTQEICITMGLESLQVGAKVYADGLEKIKNAQEG